MRYTVVLEEGAHNWSAYVPDVPGCVSTGHTRADCEANIREALLLHLGAMLADGQALPPSGAYTTTAELDPGELRAEAERLAQRISAD